MRTEPKIGDWHFRFSASTDVMRYERGWRVFVFQLFKWRNIPEPGTRILKRDYRGINIQFAYWLPIENI